MDSNAASSDANMAAIDALMAIPEAVAVTDANETAMPDAPALTEDTHEVSSTVRIPRAPALVDFKALRAEEQAQIHRISHDIGLAWSVCSPASPFPYKFLPDPDPNTWGYALLAAIGRLAKLTSKAEEAARLVCHSIERENEGTC